MKAVTKFSPSETADAARRRLLSVQGDPFLFADWKRVVFLHFVMDPELLRTQVPHPFELELHEGAGCVSLAAVTMRRFRPCRLGSMGWLFQPILEQRFFNLRTYVSYGEEPGVLFVNGWLSQPFWLGLPSGLFSLPYAFAALEYDHHYETGDIHGQVMANRIEGRFVYRASVNPKVSFEPCVSGSLAEFALERDTGFFCRGDDLRVFRAWHPPWLQAPIDMTVEDDSLLTTKFPWFKEAKLAAANFAPGFERVWLGRAHRLEKTRAAQSARKVLSAFFEMP
jgi:uncharacterized protein